MNLSLTRRNIGVLICSLVFAAIGAWAQTGTTALNGDVTDPQGAAVAGAQVTLTQAGTGTGRSMNTDANGHYQFQALPPGVYSVRVETKGFRTLVQESVELLVATNRRLDFRLELGQVTESIEVSGAAPTINLQDATTGNPFDEKEVKGLPFLARNVVSLLTLQPGVVFTGNSDTDRLSQGDISTLDGREGAVNGVRGNQTNVTLDGVDSNDWQNQAAFTSALPVTLDSVQEFRVTTANANATDGVASGAQVALVTKSGTNDYHGNVRWYYRTSGASANSFFNKQATPPIGRPKLQRNIGGGSLGGPIKKDRAFFFLDYETRREASSFSVVPRQVPSDALKNGVLVYACANGTSDPQCQGSTVIGVNGQPVTVAAGNFGLSPANIQAIDPAGLGINPAMIAYMKNLPSGNSPSQGFDNGLTFNGLIFNAPLATLNNVYTARMDYNITKNGRHAIYARGVLGGLKSDLIEANYPGEAPTSTLLNNSRGVVVGYTAQIRNNITNSFHYGFTRLGVSQSGAQGPLFDVRDFTDILNFSRLFGHQVPVNEFKDDMSWTHGRHTVQIGGGLRYIRNHRQDETLSFPNFNVNNGFCVSLCKGPARSLGTSGAGASFPVANDTTRVTRALMMLTGSITQVNTSFFLANPSTGGVLPQDSTELREFAENDYEIYGQDTWRLKNNLTITAGLRYAYSTPPWEVHGFESAVNLDIHQWLTQREINQANGIPSSASPLLSWNLAGRANGGKDSWFKSNRKDFAPRMALAWSPGYQDGLLKAIFGGPGKTSLRLGAGIFYDRLGQAMAAETDLNGSPGVGTPLIDGSTQFSFATAPRFSGSCTFTGCTSLPPLSNFFTPITSVKFPFTPPSDTTNLGFVIDNHLHTPYTIDMNVSFQRELPKRIVLDVAYVGTLGRRLLAKADYAQYLNITDTKSKTTMFQAFNQLVKVAGETPGLFGGTAAIDPGNNSGNFTQLQTIKSIPFFDNMLPNMPAFTAGWYGNSAFASMTPTQAFYAYAVGSWTPSWSCALFNLDSVSAPVSGGFGLPTPWNSTLDPNGTGFVLFTPQFSSLPGWTNFGNSNYHSLQVSVRKSSGPVVYGVNYVFSKGIDNASGAENQDNNPNVNLTNGTLNALIQNPFDLRANRALSDFDLKHNVNGFWVADLPFGKGKRFGANSGRIKDAVIGGWEWTGTLRFHTGFPLGPSNGFNFPTNFFQTPNGSATQTISTNLKRCVPVNPPSAAPCLPNLFPNPQAILNMIVPTLPGGDGSRNIFRGPAYFATDMGVYKTFLMPWKETQHLQFRVTAFNVFNNVNFSDVFAALDPTAAGTFGQVTTTAGPRGGQREMEFAVRFEF